MTLAVRTDSPTTHQPAPPVLMYRPPRDPDAWHEVKAPGGYEWWRFEAYSHDRRTHVVATLFDGLPLHPRYIRRYFRFVNNPTRRPPPVASDYPCAYFGVFRDGSKVGQFLTQFPPGELVGSAQHPHVQIGANAMHRDEEGVYYLEMQGGRDSMKARFEFRGAVAHKPWSRRFPSRQATGADHQWIMGASQCQVAGILELDGASQVSFSGTGHHDHCLGTAPIGMGVRSRMWGHAATEAGAVSFQQAQPRDRRLADETCLVQADADGIRELRVTASGADSAQASLPGALLAPPERLDFGEALRMWRPRVVDSSLVHAQVTYEASSYGRRTEARCTILYPSRAGWPIVGRLLELNIQRGLAGNGE